MTEQLGEDIELAELRFLSANQDRLAEFARVNQASLGRGAWIAHIGPRCMSARWEWVTLATFEAAAGQGAYTPGQAAAVMTLIGSYDPQSEFVLVARHEDGPVTWQAVGFALPV